MSFLLAGVVVCGPILAFAIGFFTAVAWLCRRDARRAQDDELFPLPKAVAPGLNEVDVDMLKALRRRTS